MGDFIRDTSRNPFDYDRTTRPRAGEAIKDTAKLPGLVIVVAGLVAFVLALVNFALGQVGLGVTSVIVALLAAGGGLAWLAAEGRRFRQAERDLSSSRSSR